MCGVVVIVTRWWLAWLLVSVASVMCLLGSNLSPSWLMGPSPDSQPIAALMKASPEDTQPSFTPAFLQEQFSSSSAYQTQERPSLGLWIRCTLMGSSRKSTLHCGVYATRVPDLPHAQIVSLAAVVSSTVLTALSCLAILSSTCIRIVKGANWFSIIGVMQAVAGVLSLIGVAVFPLAWRSNRIIKLCGEDTDMYYPSHCTVGWAVYITLVGSIGLLLSCWLSSVAARSTTTEAVAEEISKGKNLVCLI